MIDIYYSGKYNKTFRTNKIYNKNGKIIGTYYHVLDPRGPFLTGLRKIYNKKFLNKG